MAQTRVDILLNDVRSLTKFLSAYRPRCDDASFQDMCCKQAMALRVKLLADPPPCEAATEVLLLTSTTWHADAQKVIADTFEELAAISPVGSAKHNQTQRLLNFPAYCTDSLANALMAPGGVIKPKINMFAQVLVRSDLRKLSERTYRHLVAFLLACCLQNLDEILGMGDEAKHTILDQMKEAVKEWAQYIPKPTRAILWNFPDTPRELKEIRPDIYAAAFECAAPRDTPFWPIPQIELMRATKSIPMRRRKNAPVGSSSADMLTLMKTVMQHITQQKATSLPPTEVLTITPTSVVPDTAVVPHTAVVPPTAVSHPRTPAAVLSTGDDALLRSIEDPRKYDYSSFPSSYYYFAGLLVMF